jgi:hypothetical protein
MKRGDLVTIAIGCGLGKSRPAQRYCVLMSARCRADKIASSYLSLVPEQCMKVIGRRMDPPLSPQASGELLAEGSRFCESIGWLARGTFVPKGVYRYPSHAAANQHAQDCLARGMARLAAHQP